MDSFEALKKYLVYSLSFHALVLTLILLFGGEGPPPAPPQATVTMIRLSRGSGDLRDLPPQRSAPSAPAPIPAKPPPPAAPAPATPPIPLAKPAPVIPVTPPTPAKPAPAPAKPQPTVHLGKDKPKPPPAPAKPAPPAAPAPDEQKLAEALGQVQQELKQREAAAQAAVPAPGSPEGGGTGGSPFGTPGGRIGAADPGLAQYQSNVRAKIIREWVRANTGPDGGEAVRTRVQVRINASGQVIGKNVVKRSGNESFDLSALRAIERASPLPPPPPGLESEALSEGFIVDFSSRMLGRN